MDQWGGRARATALSWAHWGGSAVMGKVASVGSLDFFIIYFSKAVFSSAEKGEKMYCSTFWFYLVNSV
jgi:hypothetical protein